MGPERSLSLGRGAGARASNEFLWLHEGGARVQLADQKLPRNSASTGTGGEDRDKDSASPEGPGAMRTFDRSPIAVEHRELEIEGGLRREPARAWHTNELHDTMCARPRGEYLRLCRIYAEM